MKTILNFQMRTAQMMLEAQTVVTLRMLGMAGVLPQTSDETRRMVSEKQAAFGQAGMAVAGALMAGKTPAQAYGLGLTPIGRTTRANAKRLSKLG